MTLQLLVEMDIYVSWSYYRTFINTAAAPHHLLKLSLRDINSELLKLLIIILRIQCITFKALLLTLFLAAIASSQCHNSNRPVLLQTGNDWLRQVSTCSTMGFPFRPSTVKNFTSSQYLTLFPPRECKWQHVRSFWLSRCYLPGQQLVRHWFLHQGRSRA